MTLSVARRAPLSSLDYEPRGVAGPGTDDRGHAAPTLLSLAYAIGPMISCQQMKRGADPGENRLSPGRSRGPGTPVAPLRGARHGGGLPRTLPSLLRQTFINQSTGKAAATETHACTGIPLSTLQA